MTISLIAALSKNGVIGTESGGLPWHLPRDVAHFRNYTARNWMLLGRKTFREMEGWFTDQTPIVLTRSDPDHWGEIRTADCVEAAIKMARENGAQELVVSGGASVYEAALPFVEKMVVTRVDTKIDCGVFFPDFDRVDWELDEEVEFAPDEENEFAMTIQVLCRSKALELGKQFEL